MDDLETVRTREYKRVYNELLCAAAGLDVLHRLKADGVEPHAGAAMHAVRFAAAMLWQAIPDVPSPGFRHNTHRQLELAAHWREAALGIGEFATPPPALEIVRDTTPTT